ncbi:glycosyltransferase family 39 protein [Streptomyces sp. 8K308]|uniref:ArnT family glycosyltransferase n=1 Tax=Streptomyces sp. 8K308 TaxID=2530388 RepID=UPI001048A2D3|nr:glycosyltransferase family 39 protein [Streptomyces sp. 8K308]TDC05943.1 glycosyltransferase family 39 protein [Streptomyces sp. 8K308]
MTASTTTWLAPEHPVGPTAAPPRPVARPWRGRPDDPRWARPTLFALLALTAVLYVWNLSASGYANSFYSAAAQAGGSSWKAFFFGSLDAGGAITVDKPPAALWPMGLSVRLFGLSSWAILLPEALMGVATVAVLHAAVRRAFSPAAGLIAGAVLAVTPVAALMFRFNNPDALLCLLMVTAVYCVLRALEHAGTRWLVLAGVAFGLAFLTKTLQAFLILPPLALVYAACAPTRPLRRLRQLSLAGLALLVSGGWWVAIVELWPASSRPYVGGSQNNSFLELTFGYNGLGRITGDETGSVGGGGGWGETGLFRLFDDAMGGQIAWLLPAAFLLLAAGLVVTARAPRTDRRRAAFLAWGGALFFTFTTFSFMSGIFHEYYNVALAPYLAALVGMGATTLWARRDRPAAAATLAAVIVVTACWAYVLLDRTPEWHPWLRWAVLLAGLVAGTLLLRPAQGGRPLTVAVAATALLAALAGPVAYTLYTIGQPHTGSVVTAGPAVTTGFGGFGGGGGQNPGGGFRFQPPGGATTTQPGQPGQRPGQPRTGGLLDGADVSDELAALLEADAGQYRWVAATVGAQKAASYQLATGDPVMAVGGFNGTDPSPTLEQFVEYVEHGDIHYFIAGGMGMGRSGTSEEIATWVAENFTATTVDGVTLYDLTPPL